MGVSWQDHSINFSLGWSATCWLLKNIVSLRELNLNISGDVSQTALQDVMEAGRNLTCLSIRSKHIMQLPCLPPKLEQLSLGDCSNLSALPALPSCTSLYLNGCEQLQQLPEQLPRGLKVLECSDCIALQQLPKQLPAGLTRLDCSGCSALQQLPTQVPAGLRHLNCSGCSALQQLPEQLPAGLTSLDCSNCSALQQLPVHLPPMLEQLWINYCVALKQLPELPPTLKDFRCDGCSCLPP
uniref:Uncharacterized protein n=1 Tax=Tetradesmus obliquus TaxID=3088 RepID=A0A383V862_TETOB|eukprot:jgi/Sobl393_1/17171/SZX61768.1